jgi:hypothetical protein
MRLLTCGSRPGTARPRPHGLRCSYVKALRSGSGGHGQWCGLDDLVGSHGGEHGVGQLTTQEPEGGGAVLAAAVLLGQVGLPGPTPRAWVTAIMCSAQLACRLPPRLRRTFPAVAPDHTGTGAVPVNRA